MSAVVRPPPCPGKITVLRCLIHRGRGRTEAMPICMKPLELVVVRIKAIYRRGNAITDQWVYLKILSEGQGDDWQTERDCSVDSA